MLPCDASAERERRVLSHWFPRRPHCCQQVRPPYEKDHGQIFPEPTVVQVLFKDSSVVLLLLLTLTTLLNP